MTLLMTTGSLTIAAGAVIFLVITLILVGALLAAKAKLVPSGNVDLKVNGEKHFAGWFAKWWYLLVFCLWWWW